VGKPLQGVLGCPGFAIRMIRSALGGRGIRIRGFSIVADSAKARPAFNTYIAIPEPFLYWHNWQTDSFRRVQS
jgi:hypothetical protein